MPDLVVRLQPMSVVLCINSEDYPMSIQGISGGDSGQSSVSRGDAGSFDGALKPARGAYGSGGEGEREFASAGYKGNEGSSSKGESGGGYKSVGSAREGSKS
jgi:hypothetical protein